MMIEGALKHVKIFDYKVNFFTVLKEFSKCVVYISHIT